MTTLQVSVIAIVITVQSLVANRRTGSRHMGRSLIARILWLEHGMTMALQLDFLKDLKTQISKKKLFC